MYERLAWVASNIPKMDLLDVFGLVAQAAMIFGGVVPYIPQYRTIRRTLSSEGFSTLVCFVLLVANLLRIFFWFGKHFELPLLAQSVLMIFAMMAMVEICVRVRNRSEIVQPRQHHLRDLDFTYFWKWTDFLSYVEFMLCLSAVLSISTYFLIDVPIYVESIGFLAVFIEAMLGIPQAYRNFSNGSTDGMSVSMVIMWLCGDTFKTGYFVVREAPKQFWICGALQICVDLAILGQVVFYSIKPSSASHPTIHKQ